MKRVWKSLLAATIALVVALAWPAAAHATQSPVKSLRYYTEVWNANDGGFWIRDSNGNSWKFYMSPSYMCDSGYFANPGQICWDYYAQSYLVASGSLGGEVYDSFCAEMNADGRAEVFVKARGKDVNHIWQTTSSNPYSWSTWHTLGGLIADGRGVECPNPTPVENDLVFRVWGPDGMYHYKQQLTPGGDWTPNWF